MKQLAILIVSIMIIAGLWGWAYMFWISRQSEQPASAIISTEPAVFSDSELQSEVVFFLTKELGIYEGGFEVVDVARVDAAAIAGIEYLVVTMRAPDGRLCQVAVRKSLKPNAAWELDPSSFSVLGTDGYGRSDTRAALRRHFEVDRYYVVVAALKALADQGKIEAGKVSQAIQKYELNIDRAHPVDL